MSVLLKATNIGLKKSMFGQWIFKDFDLTLSSSEKIAIYGSTASGKSAVLHVLSGYIKASSGKVKREGKIAYCTQKFLLYDDLTINENLDFTCAINNFKHPSRKEFLEKTGLIGWEKVRAGNLPEGMRKMLQLACAFSQDFSIMVIDEPTNGLDHNLKEKTWKILNEFASNGKGIIIATATDEDLEHIDRIISLDEHLEKQKEINTPKSKVEPEIKKEDKKTTLEKNSPKEEANKNANS